MSGDKNAETRRASPVTVVPEASAAVLTALGLTVITYLSAMRRYSR